MTIEDKLRILISQHPTVYDDTDPQYEEGFYAGYQFAISKIEQLLIEIDREEEE